MTVATMAVASIAGRGSDADRRQLLAAGCAPKLAALCRQPAQAGSAVEALCNLAAGGITVFPAVAEQMDAIVPLLEDSDPGIAGAAVRTVMFCVGRGGGMQDEVQGFCEIAVRCGAAPKLIALLRPPDAGLAMEASNTLFALVFAKNGSGCWQSGAAFVTVAAALQRACRRSSGKNAEDACDSRV